MPIYEYECGSCHHKYERMVRIGAEPPPCPECSSAEVRKLVSQSGFILKGGGWYKDHYGLKNGGSKSTESTTTKSEGGSSTSTAASTPSAPSAPSTPSTPAKA